MACPWFVCICWALGLGRPFSFYFIALPLDPHLRPFFAFLCFNPTSILFSLPTSSTLSLEDSHQPSEIQSSVLKISGDVAFLKLVMSQMGVPFIPFLSLFLSFSLYVISFILCLRGCVGNKSSHLYLQLYVSSMLSY